MGVTGTPTVFVGSYRMEDPTSLAEYERVITAQLQQ
jgi:protein-disulfide isomerase